MELPDLHARSKGLLMTVPSLAHPTTAILTCYHDKTATIEVRTRV